MVVASPHPFHCMWFFLRCPKLRSQLIFYMTDTLSLSLPISLSPLSTAHLFSSLANSILGNGENLSFSPSSLRRSLRLRPKRKPLPRFSGARSPESRPNSAKFQLLETNADGTFRTNSVESLPRPEIFSYLTPMIHQIIFDQKVRPC